MKKKVKHTISFLSWPVISTVIVLGLILWLHSPWMENWTIDKLEGLFKEHQFQLQIESLKYNLLKGQLELRNVHLTKGNLQVDADFFTLNGSYELLFGDLVFDHINFFGGTISWANSPGTEPSLGEIEQTSIPDFTLHSAHIRDLKIKHGTSSQQVDFQLSDVEGNYAWSKLNLAWTLVLPHGDQSQRLHMDLEANTPDFINYEALKINLSQENLNLSLAGHIFPNKDIELKLNGTTTSIGDAPFYFDAGLKNRHVFYSLCGKLFKGRELIITGESDLPSQLKQGFDLPFDANIDGLIQGGGILEWASDSSLGLHYSGDILAKAFPNLLEKNLIMGLDGSLNDNHVWEMSYGLQPDESPLNQNQSLQGLVLLDPAGPTWIHSENQILTSQVEAELRYDYGQEQRVSLQLDGHSLGESIKKWSHHTSDDFQSTTNLDCLGRFNGWVEGHGTTLSNMELSRVAVSQQVDLASVASFLTPSSNSHWLVIEGSGPLDQFKATLEEEMDAPVANLNIDLIHGRFNAIQMELEKLVLSTGGGPLVIGLLGEGQGPWVSPEFDGFLRVHYLDPAPPFKPKAMAEGNLGYHEGMFELNQFKVSTKQLMLNASGQYQPDDPNCWAVHLNMQTARHNQMASLLEFEVPQLSLEVDADSDGIKGRLKDLKQDPTKTHSWDVPVDLNSLLKYAQWSDNRLLLGGLLIDRVGLDVVQGIPRLRGEFSIIDPELVSAVYYFWRFDPLEYKQLDGAFQWDFLPGECSGFHLFIDRLVGTMFDENLVAENWSIDLGQGLSFQPLSGHFGGADIQVLDHFRYQSDSAIPSTIPDPDLQFSIEFSIVDRERFNRFGQHYFWDFPRNESFQFDLKAFTLGFQWSRDFYDFGFWATLPDCRAEYMNQKALVRDGTIFWGNELLLHGEDVVLNDHNVSIKALPGRTHLEIPIQVEDVSKAFPQVFGDGVGLFQADWHYEWDRNLWDVTLSQNNGRVNYEFPKSEIRDFNLHFKHDTGLFTVDKCQFEYNGGRVKAHGRLSRKNELNQFEIEADHIGLDFTDYLLESSFQVQLKGIKGGSILSGDVTAHNGYMVPVNALASMIQSLFPEFPQLDLPNPSWNAIHLDLHGRTESPLVVDHPLAYLEAEIPDIYLKGTLAAPLLDSGEVRIMEGSEINLRNEQFVFKPSLIQFSSDHPEDPFFQISMEHMDRGVPKPIQMVGYFSDILKGDTDATDIVSVIVSYMMGKVSSMINLETESNENVFDKDFALVLSKTLGRRLTTRYVVPLDLDQAQEFEIGYGPHSGYFFNFVRDEYNRVNVSKLSHFGFPGKGGEEHIRQLNIHLHGTGHTDITKNWIVRKWNLRRGDVYTETALRHSKHILEKELRANGYLSPEVKVDYVDRHIHLDITPGALFQLIPIGLDLDKSERKEIFRRLASRGESRLTSLKSYLEALIVEKGFLPGQVEIQMDGTNVHLQFHPGKKVKKYNIYFGDAQTVMAPMVHNRRWVKQFIKSYLEAPTGTRKILRNLLAASGYVTPRIGKGQFNAETDLFSLPVKPRKRSLCGTITCRLNGEILELEPLKRYENQPFDYDMVEKSLEAIRAYCKKVNSELSSFQIFPTFRNQTISIEIKGFSLKDPLFSSVNFSGNRVLRSESVSHLIRLGQLIKKTDLVEAQRRLIKAGQFSFIALQTTDDGGAQFELNERNRYDLEYGVGWSDETGAGFFVQFKDRMFLRGPHDWVARVEANEYEYRQGTQFQFRNPWGIYGDLLFTLENDEVHSPNPQMIAYENGMVQFAFRKPKLTKAVLEYRIPITRWNRFQLGVEYNKLNEQTRLSMYSGSTSSSPYDTYTSNQRTLTPLKVSWAYENIDNYLLPRNGMMTSFGIEIFDRGLGNDDLHSGQRVAGNFTGFFKWGPFLVQQRVKLGAFFPNEKTLLTGSPGDPILFFLGGGNTLRGVERDSMGPTDPETGLPIGGQAMAFSSTELTYLTGWSGFGISPFLDGGQVWDEIGNAAPDDMVWTAGVGFVFDTTIGYFRLDFVDLVKGEYPENARKSWHFRIGRVF